VQGGFVLNGKAPPSFREAGPHGGPIVVLAL
jgi:hypothetical protein